MGQVLKNSDLVNKISPVFELGLIGYPLGHSFSPRLHLAALEAAGLRGYYRLYPISPDQDQSDLKLRKLIERIVSGKITGLNVTIPFKQKVIGLLDRLTDVAAQIEAVNTIFIENGCLTGENTDVPGFLVDVTNCVSGIDTQADVRVDGLPDLVMVLGAGGSARAVVYALARRGKRIILVSRRKEQADRLIDSLISSSGLFKSEPFPETVTFSHLDKAIGKLQDQEVLIVNTTPVGMWPDVNDCPWPEHLAIPTKAMVYDLIYNPRETLLMKQAMNAGLPAWNGLGMLVEQAALAFERWTGINNSAPKMWEALNHYVDKPLNDGLKR